MPDGTLFYSTSLLDPANGAVIWSDGFSGLTPALDENGRLYALSSSQLRSYHARTGGIRWTVNLPGVGVDSPAIDARGVVYVTTDSGDVVAVHPNGTILWQVHVCELFKTSPVIGPQNTVIAYGREGFEDFIYAVR
jgi:outer membrane protein assembly factor BamB